MQPEFPVGEIETLDGNRSARRKECLAASINLNTTGVPVPYNKYVEEKIRAAKTLGQLERLAGIETSEDRTAFWLQFSHLRNRARKAGEIELKLIIRAKLDGAAHGDRAQSIWPLKLAL